MPDHEKELQPVNAAREGNERAWDVLFQRYRWPLYVFLAESVQDEQIALDLVQEAFIKAHRHLSSLKEDERFGSWLFSIARQLSLQVWRKKAPTCVSLDETYETTHDDTPDPLQTLIQIESGQQCLEALKQLSFTHREVLVLCYLQEFKLEQIAEITDVSIGTVKSRLHFARKSLNTILTSKNHENATRTID